MLEISVDEIVDYILTTKKSIRRVASYYGCSKTFVWSKLKQYNGSRKNELEELLKSNKEQSQKALNENKTKSIAKKISKC